MQPVGKTQGEARRALPQRDPAPWGKEASGGEHSGRERSFIRGSWCAREDGMEVAAGRLKVLLRNKRLGRKRDIPYMRQVSVSCYL